MSYRLVPTHMEYEYTSGLFLAIHEPGREIFIWVGFRFVSWLKRLGICQSLRNASNLLDLRAQEKINSGARPWRKIDWNAAAVKTNLGIFLTNQKTGRNSIVLKVEESNDKYSSHLLDSKFVTRKAT